jgi:hypothetical protein
MLSISRLWMRGAYILSLKHPTDGFCSDMILIIDWSRPLIMYGRGYDKMITVVVIQSLG